jgi:hypothetical protein
MTLYMELYDSATSAILADVVDEAHGRSAKIIEPNNNID